MFRRTDSIYVCVLHSCSTIGVLASTLGRLYASTYYALHDTRTPLGYAVIRVLLTTGLGYVCAIPLPQLIGIDPKWGAAGLTASAGVAGWIEFALLRRTLNQRIGRTGLPVPFIAKLWTGAIAGAILGWGIKLVIPPFHPIIIAGLVLVPYGVVYFAVTALFKIAEAQTVIGRGIKMVKTQRN